jgi:hypothetical protein
VSSLNEEVPVSFARFVGHVCGVIAVAMASVSSFAIWRAYVAIVDGRMTTAGAALILASLAITALFFRWAGVLTGYWNTHGRLAIPAFVYAGFGVLSVGVSLAVIWLLRSHTLTVWDAVAAGFGLVGSGIVAYWCYLLVTRQRK